LQQGRGGEEDLEADRHVAQRGGERDHRQDLQREDDLFHVVHVGEDKGRYPLHAFAEQVELQQSQEQRQCEARGLPPGLNPACAEDRTEDEAVDCDEQQRLHDVPGDAAERPLVALLDLPARQRKVSRRRTMASLASWWAYGTKPR